MSLKDIQIKNRPASKNLVDLLRGDNQVSRVTLRMPKELYLEFKKSAFESDVDMTTTINSLIREYLNRRKDT